MKLQALRPWPEGLFFIFPLLQHLPHHAATVGPDSGDVVAVEHIYGPLEPLPHRQGMAGLREVTVIHHDGVEPIAWGEAVPVPEITVAGAR